jgi:hypothetical protein
VQHAVKGQRNALLLLRSGGQETRVVERVDLQGIDFSLQLGGDLILHMPQPRCGRELAFKAQLTP